MVDEPMTELQSWNADAYARNVRFVSELGEGVVDLLASVPGEHILDLGCGDGALTERLVDAGAVVEGIDASAAMVEAARARGIEARHRNATALDYDQKFDAVFTNAALHWIADTDAVLEGVARALKPGGRFVGEFGGHGNVATITTALRAALRLHGQDGSNLQPWRFYTVQGFHKKLEAAGFSPDTVILFPRPTPLPTGMEGWLETFAGPFIDQLSPAKRAVVLATALDLMRPSLADETGVWIADYVRLRFRAVLSRSGNGR
ncbi:MAG: methyltransferase domain-containing protein [Geminicoccaceae bacterium]